MSLIFKRRSVSKASPMYMNLKEASEYLGVCRQWLAKQAKLGTVPCKIVGRKYLFNRTALDAWINQYT